MFINTTKARIIYIIQIFKIILFIFPALTFTGISIYALTGNSEYMYYIVIYILFAIPFDFLVINSIMKIMLLSKAKLYEKVFLIDKYGVIEIQTLAKNVNTKEDKVEKELTDLMKMDVIKNISINRDIVPKVLLDSGKAPKEVKYETVICPSCAAKVTKIVGKIGKCDYCGNDIM